MKSGFFAAACLCLAHAPARAYDAVRFLEPIPLPGASVAAAADSSLLYFVDGKKGSLAICDYSGKLVKASAAGYLTSPRGAALDSRGRIFVADAGDSKIKILDKDGNPAGSFGEKGSEPGRFKRPESVAVGEDGRVYVADTGNDRIQIFTSEGILLGSFGRSGKEPGQLRQPAKVMVDAADFVYVLDRGNERVQKFDPSGRFVKEYSLPGSDFVLDSYGLLYILDAKNGKIVEENAQGLILGRFGSWGSGPGQFKDPQALFLSPRGEVLILDSGNNRVQRVEVVNKQRGAKIAARAAAKFWASGPSRSWKFTAQVLAPYGGELYAYLPEPGKFVLLDGEGKEKARFSGKESSATKDAAGLAASAKFGLFVADGSGDRLQLFGLDGSWKANFAQSTGFFDSKKKEGRVRAPRGLAINEEGTVYVADSGNRRIDAFSPEGVFLFGIGPAVGSYELQEPAAVSWDAERGFLYFLDRGLKKVFKCEPSGALAAAWGEAGTGPGQFLDPVALAFDGRGFLYVLDGKLRRVSVFSKDGQWLSDLFTGGSLERELSAPVALAAQDSRLLISDKGKGRILSFDIHPFLAAPAQVSTASVEGTATLSWRVPEDGWLSGYRVYRATAAEGPYQDLGEAREGKFTDSAVTAYSSYFYRVAAEAKTRDVGPLGVPVEVVVAGAFNQPPIAFSTVAVGNIFSANYKWYLKNPMGAVSVSNNVNAAFQNVKLSFRLKDFMDFGYDTEIKRLEPLQTVEVPLIATLNNKVLEVTEDTPIQAELSLMYYENGKAQTLSLTKPLRVYSRNAITWDRPERIANFVTPKDPPVLEFAREVLRQAPQSPHAEALNPSLATALRLWGALSETGVKFLANPGNPYEKVSEDPSFPVDYTQFPRETLKRKSGQCDDLAAMIISMLFASQVRAAALDYPGHMALMLDLEASDLTEAGLPEEFLVWHDGSYWLALEPTLLGEDFLESARKAAYAYKAESAKGKARVIDIQKAWGEFEPATMPSSDWSAEVPPLEARQQRFSREAQAILQERYRSLKKYYAAELEKNPGDADLCVESGLLEYQAGNLEAAAGEFQKALARDPHSAAAMNNLGNLSFLSAEYDKAEPYYLKAAQADDSDPEIWLNLAKTSLKLKNREKAEQYGRKAVALEANLAPSVDTLLK
ncbi:MAG: hypothetical protein HY921_02935 [Elusimicrobia bacterium]|nr:hypothetical protein [Elusimicrobiota bacterium]